MHELFNFNLSFFVSPGWVFDMSEVMIYANHTQEGEVGGTTTTQEYSKYAKALNSLFLSYCIRHEYCAC